MNKRFKKYLSLILIIVLLFSITSVVKNVFFKKKSEYNISYLSKVGNTNMILVASHDHILKLIEY